MPISPDSAAKLRWAEYHLNIFQYIADEWMDSQPYSLRWEVDTNKTENAPGGKATLIGRMLREVWSDTPLVVGDIVHNMRCALDYITYRLSALPVGDRARRKVQFPIFDYEAEWTTRHKNVLAGVDPAVIEMIEAEQPYHHGRLNDPLAILREISNADKHHAIRVVAARGKLIHLRFGATKLGHGNVIHGGMPISTEQPVDFSKGVYFAPFGGFVDFGSKLRTEPVGDGEMGTNETELLRLFPDPNDEIYAEPQMSFQIQFARGQPGIEGREVVPTLRLILDRVKEICRKLP